MTTKEKEQFAASLQRIYRAADSWFDVADHVSTLLAAERRKALGEAIALAESCSDSSSAGAVRKIEQLRDKGQQ